MAILKGVGDFFGLDIGTTAVRAVQLSPSGAGRWSLRHYGYAPTDIKTVLADSPESRHRLGEIIMTVVGQSGIKTKNVAIGLPANKTFVTVVDMPNVSPAEIESTIKYQLDQYIPTAADVAKVDWALLGQSLHDPSQQEVLLASTEEAYAEDRLEFVESLGFNVIAAEPDSLAMIRAVLPANAQDVQMIVDVGAQSTNVAIVHSGTPRLVRTIPSGLDTFVHAAVQNLGVQEDQARQFILKFGLAPDKLEGQVVRALENTLDGFVSELQKSLKFFQTRYPSLATTDVIITGFASMIPQMPEYVANKIGIRASIANPWQYVSVPSNDKEIMATAAEFAVAVGLAQRGGKA